MGVVGDDFPASFRGILAEREIDTSGLVTESGKTFRWKGRYHAACVVDASTWGVRITTEQRTTRRVGLNAAPRSWVRLRELVARTVGQDFG